MRPTKHSKNLIYLFSNLSQEDRRQEEEQRELRAVALCGLELEEQRQRPQQQPEPEPAPAQPAPPSTQKPGRDEQENNRLLSDPQEHPQMQVRHRQGASRTHGAVDQADARGGPRSQGDREQGPRRVCHAQL